MINLDTMHILKIRIVEVKFTPLSSFDKKPVLLNRFYKRINLLRLKHSLSLSLLQLLLQQYRMVQENNG